MAPKSQERNPYVGPRPFEWQDRDLFFGRDREAGEILFLIFTHRDFLIHGQSGAGKTSLLNAALIPLLEEEGFEVLPPARVRGPVPQNIEPEEIPNLYVFNTLMSWAEDEADLERLAQMSLPDFLKEQGHRTDEEELPSPRVVIFDQFEELFAFYLERLRDREDFFEQIRDALKEDPLLRAVFVIREDYIAQLDPYAPLLPEKLRTRFRMERLRREAALTAVKGPLRDTKRSFAEGVAEQLVEELLKIRVETSTGQIAKVAEEFVEPMQLQVVCQRLWQDLPPDVTVVTQNHLPAFGDVNQTLSGFYERSIERATQETGVKKGKLRTWFGKKLITPVGTRGTVFKGQEETGGIPNAAVEVLENLHLIRLERRAGGRWYELTHDRFIEPIQDSNKKWREKKQRTVFTALGTAVAALVVVLAIAFATTRATQSEQASKIQQVEAAATGVVAEATRAKVTTDLGVAKTVGQSQATATAVAAELSEVRATVEAAANDHVSKGSDYAKKEDYEQAIAAYAEAIKLVPNNAIAYYKRGGVYADIGDYEQAIADYTKAIELDPNHAEAYYNRGLAYANLEDYQKAIAAYNKAIELDPNYALAYYERGNAYADLGDYGQAISDFTKAIELDPNYALAYYERGNAYADLGDYGQAISDFTKAIELAPYYAKAYYNRGLAYIDLVDHEQAIADFTKAGNAYRRLRDYEQAITSYTKAIELDPNYASAYYKRANAYADQGNHGQAIADYNKAIELDPKYVEAYFGRGLAYENLKDYQQAIADFANAIELDPNYLEAYYKRGLAHANIRNYEQAIADFTKAIELDPNDVETYYNRGLAYANQGDHQQAITDFTKAIELDPDYAIAYHKRGNVYANLGDYEQAIADYSKAADAYRKLGDDVLASYNQDIADYTKDIELDPNDPWEYYYRGLAYANLGDKENAISDLEIALQLTEPPLDENALETARAMLERLRGQ